MSDNAKSDEIIFEDVDYHELLDESLLKSQRLAKKRPFYYKNTSNILNFNVSSAGINEHFIDTNINIVMNDSESLANFSERVVVNTNGNSMEIDNRKCLLNDIELCILSGNSERIETDDYIHVVNDSKQHVTNRSSEHFHKRQMSNLKDVEETSTIESVTSLCFNNNDYNWNTNAMKLSLFEYCKNNCRIDETYSSSLPHDYITTKRSSSSDSEWDLANVEDADDPCYEISETSSLYVNFCSDFEGDLNVNKIKLIKQEPELKPTPNESVKSVKISSIIQNKEQHHYNERLQNAKKTKPKVHQLRESSVIKTNKMYVETKNRPWENVDKYNKYSTKRSQHPHRESSYTRHSSARYRRNEYHRDRDYIRTHSPHKKYYKERYPTHERKHYKTVEYNHRHFHRDSYNNRKSQRYSTSRRSPAYRPTYSYKMTETNGYREDRRKPYYNRHSKYTYKRHYYGNRRSCSYDRSKHYNNSEKYYNRYNTSKTSRSTSHKKTTVPWY